jgi:hypothetical protein
MKMFGNFIFNYKAFISNYIHYMLAIGASKKQKHLVLYFFSNVKIIGIFLVMMISFDLKILIEILLLLH